MRVLLIQPPMILHKTDIPQFGHPLGLAYIAAFLREHGCEVSILDSIISNPVGQKNGEWIHIGLDWDSIMKKVSEYKPRVVGISCMFTSQAEYLHRLAKLVKDINRNIVTVVGGAHVFRRLQCIHVMLVIQQSDFVIYPCWLQLCSRGRNEHIVRTVHGTVIVVIANSLKRGFVTKVPMRVVSARHII